MLLEVGYLQMAASQTSGMDETKLTSQTSYIDYGPILARTGSNSSSRGLCPFSVSNMANLVVHILLKFSVFITTGRILLQYCARLALGPALLVVRQEQRHW